MKLALVLLRLGLGALLIIAGALKLGDPTAFAVDITNYRFLPSLAPWLAATLPTVEIATGLGLLAPSGEWRRAAALVAAGLMAAFTVATAQAVGRGINVSCGCFGGAAGPVTWLTVARDLALLVGAVTLVVKSPSPTGMGS
jgi:hypothetical protein